MIRRVTSKLGQLSKSLFRKLGYEIIAMDAPVRVSSDLDTALAQFITKPNPICFDIGANIGQTIQKLIEQLRQPVIHAFEPDPNCIDVLNAKFSSPSITINQAGIGAKQGTLAFNVYEHNYMNSFRNIDSEALKKSFGWAEEELSKKITVDITSVDDYCNQNHIKDIDLLKIDTQGYEDQVLAGASQMLQEQRIQIVLFEVNFASLYKNQANWLELFSTLHEAQYTPVSLYEQVRHRVALDWCTAMFVVKTNLKTQPLKPKTVQFY